MGSRGRFAISLAVSFINALTTTAVALWIFAPLAPAQMNTAEITGVVEDASGAVVPGVSVTAVQLGTQLKFTAATNETGQYALEQLPLGDYSLTVSAPRFKEAVHPHVTLHVGDHAREDFALEVGKIDQVVVVEAEAGPLQEESAEIKDVVEMLESWETVQARRIESSR